jgi:hypothetical protein
MIFHLVSFFFVLFSSSKEKNRKENDVKKYRISLAAAKTGRKNENER